MSLYGTIPSGLITGGRVNNDSDRAVSANTSGQSSLGADFSAFIEPKASKGCNSSNGANIASKGGSGLGDCQWWTSTSALDGGITDESPPSDAPQVHNVDPSGGADKKVEARPSSSVSWYGEIGALGYSGRTDGTVTNGLPGVDVPLELGEGDEPGGSGDVTNALPKAGASLDGEFTGLGYSGRTDGTVTNGLPGVDVPLELGEGDELGDSGDVTSALPKAGASLDGKITGLGYSGRTDGTVTNGLPGVDVPLDLGEGDEPGGSGDVTNALPKAGASLDIKSPG